VLIFQHFVKKLLFRLFQESYMISAKKKTKKWKMKKKTLRTYISSSMISR
jgi:hypothetical protein